MAGELLVPIARRMGNSVVQQTRQPGFNQNVVILRTKEQAQLLSQIFGGRAAMPKQNVVVVGPDGRTPIMVATLGVTEVAEIEESIHEAYEKGESTMRSYGTQIPYDKFREKRGLMQREKVDSAIRDAMRRRVAAHQRNPISDPGRITTKVKGQSMVTMPEKNWS